MKSIGIRVSPAVVYFAVVQQEQHGFTFFNERIVVPKALDVPRQLAFIRTTLISVIAEYNIAYAGVKLTEGNAQRVSVPRLNLEGVVLELFANSSIEKYVAGTISSLTRLLSEESGVVKRYLDGDTFFQGIDGWNANFKKEEREAIVTGVAALNL